VAVARQQRVEDRIFPSTVIDPQLWEGVRRLTLQAPTVADVVAHRLHALAAAYWTEAGRAVPTELAEHARHGRELGLAAPLLLERVRAACSGPLLLMKGPEAAACYERPRLRPYGDLDLLVPDAATVQRELVTAGFVPVGEERLYLGIHHLRPLHLPGFPLVVEVHSRPKWVEGAPAPGVAELVDGAVPSATGVEGILAPRRSHHALVLAVHAWAHEPLGLLSQLVDVAAVRQGAAASELEAVSSAWGVRRLWQMTSRTIDALFLDGPAPWPLRVWARNLPRARERTMLELHLQRWLSALSTSSPRAAAAAAFAAVADDLRPEPGERWGRKARRSALSVRHAFRRQSLHDAESERRYGPPLHARAREEAL
jgi:putative nucleotidyltransferase-like protein